MACGSYHSMVVLGEPSKAFKKVRENMLTGFLKVFYIGGIGGKIGEEIGDEMVSSVL